MVVFRLVMMRVVCGVLEWVCLVRVVSEESVLLVMMCGGLLCIVVIVCWSCVIWVG